MQDNNWAEKRNLQFLYWSAMCGFICIIGYLIFWAGIAHMVPVPPQAWSPKELADNYLIPYQHDILVGMMGCGFFGMLWLPHAAALTVLMTRKEFNAPALAFTQFFAGGITAWVMASSPMGWAIAAKFAPLDPVLAHSAWLKEWYIYDSTYMITLLQVVPTGIYILSDKTKHPIFPRWLGWFSIYVGLSYVPLSWMPFNDTGPLSYDGLWNFWILYAGGYAFYPISTVYMLRHIKREMRALDGAPQPQYSLS